jgi:hypothetical protein
MKKIHYTTNQKFAAILAILGHTPETETVNGSTIYTYKLKNQTIKYPNKMKTLSKLEFLTKANEICEKSTLKFIEDGERVKWFNNYDSRAKAVFMANQHGRNSWTYDLEKELQPS